MIVSFLGCVITTAGSLVICFKGMLSAKLKSSSGLMEIVGAVILATIVPVVVLTTYLTMTTGKGNATTYNRSLSSGGQSLETLR